MNICIDISMGWCKKDITPLPMHWSYAFLVLTHRYIKGILQNGPHPPCLRMAGRALLAGYPWYMAPAVEELNLSQAIQSTRLAETNIRVTPVFLAVSIWNHTCKWPIMSHYRDRTRLMLPILPAHFWFVCSNIAWHREHIMKCSCWHGLLPGHLSSLACRNSHLIPTF